VAIHHRLDGASGIDLGDDDIGAHAFCAEGQAFAAPAVTGDNELGARDQRVGAADDAIHSGLPGTVAVVEHVLGLGVVDGNDGVLEHAIFRHGPQTDDAGSSLFSAGDDVGDGILALC
jgi:hypothetical protein